MPLRLMLSDSDGGREYVLALLGPLDPATAKEFRAWLTHPAPDFGVVIDLSAAAPIGPDCVALVADANRKLVGGGHRVRVIAPDDAAAAALTAAGVRWVVIDRREENRLAPGARVTAA
jgi:hypothetical protein